MADARPPDDVLREPDLPPSPILNPEACQIVVGILEKYVHLGRGWRKRLFVLERGVLRYYKVESQAGISEIRKLLETLSEAGELRYLGNELRLLDSRSNSSKGNTGAPQGPGSLVVQGELHLQVAAFKISESGDKKRFNIFSGTKKLSCRAESELDKTAWLDALQLAKESWGGGDGHSGVLFPSLDEPQDKMPSGAGIHHLSSKSMVQRTFNNSTLPDVRRRLQEGSVSPGLCTFIEEILVQQHRFYINYMTEEGEKRKQLIRYIKRLEEDKRQLEQQLVVPECQDTLSDVTSIQGDRIYSTEHASGSELDNDEERDSDDGSDMDDNDIFFDCHPIDQGKPHNREKAPAEESTEPEVPGSNDAPVGERLPAASGQVTTDYPDGQTSELTAASNGNFEMDANLSSALKKAIKKMDDWLRADGPPPKKRDRLPKPKQKEKVVSLWSIIKSCVGKDLTKVCLPVYFNEPLSALQKSAEDMEYSELLDKAIRFPPGSVERLLHIAAFAVSGYAATEGRTNKPFNPLLGETFELVDAEKGYRFIGEKVIHHPTVFAFHCEGRGWSIDADGDVKNKFYGAGIELRPVGSIEVATADGEVYQWNKVLTSINNLIIGKLYVDHYGIMKVRNKTAGIAAKMKFVATGRLFDRNPHQVTGHVEGKNGKVPGYSISGTWSNRLCADFGNGPQEIWKKSSPAPEPTRYNFSKFAITLNELFDGLEEKLAPTDCRLRPDQRFTEIGMYDKANNEKQRLEHKQRAARKAAEEGEAIKPRWFEQVESGKQGEELIFKYKGGYWSSRDSKTYEGCRDIFGQ